MRNKQIKVLHYLHTLKAFGFSFHEPVFFKQNKIDTFLPDSLAKLNKVVFDCTLCDLSKSRKNVVFGWGNANSKVMFVGEAPGITEDEAAKPFVGNSGDLLDKIIQTVLLKQMDEFYFTNIIKCKTPNNRLPTPNEVMYCKPYIEQQIEIIQPKLIVALGSTSFKYLMGSDENIQKLRGQVLQYSKDISLVATFHPSFLLRNPSSKKEAFEDFKTIKNMIERFN